ncbi:MAG: CotH kinase family protein [Saprospiraceae bacterium]|nr:CotH kinase family protein [Saprospiraceae bacterium]
MILKKLGTDQSHKPIYLKVAFAIIFLSLLIYGATTLFKQKGNHKLSKIICTAEKVKNGKFVDGDYTFQSGNLQSNEMAFGGNYSCKLKKGTGLQFGFGIDASLLKPNTNYIARVWRYAPTHIKNNGLLVVDYKGKSDKFSTTFVAVQKSKSGWEQLEIAFSTDDVIKENSKIYVMTDGSGDFYFDDLSLEIINNDNQPSKLDVLEIHIDSKGKQILQKSIELAFKAGILSEESQQWFDANLLDNSSGKVIQKDAEIRLKGDYLNHLENNKQSFRIHLKPGETWKRMITFSIQTPVDRGFLNEWLLHQWWLKEGVLTTRYGFVKVKINEESKGIYAYEEHFEKQLLESKDRREGPILKLSEDGFWATNQRMFQELGYGSSMLTHQEREKSVSDVRAFNENKLRKDETQNKLFENARSLLSQYKDAKIDAKYIFDLDKCAKYYAIADLMGAYHGVAWHNERFYFNPVINKLEPIGYDGFPSEEGRFSILGAGAMNDGFLDESILFPHLFKNKEFVALYDGYLAKFSDLNYINNFLYTLQDSILTLESEFKKEFPTYTFNNNFVYENAAKVRTLLYPYDDYSVKAYYKNDKSKNIITLANAHSLPIEVVGFGYRKNGSIEMLDQPLWLPGKHSQAVLKFSDLNVAIGTKIIYYRLPGFEKMYHTTIIPWSLPPTDFIEGQDFVSRPLEKRDELYTIDKQNIIFKPIKIQIKTPIIIPQGYKVFIPAGANYDFVQKSYFLSYSPIICDGNSTNLIKIGSSDHSMKGFTIIQPKEKCRFTNVVFDGLNTFELENWKLTGAFTCYEGDIEFRGCKFTNNLCEDALNLVRCKFYFDSNEISNTFGDGFDADFCKGDIDNSRFVNTSNDGMDFSGSVINIKNSTMLKNGDKGLSVGENSTIYMIHCQIVGSNIGTASKDLSSLKMNDIKIEKCKIGVALYQKKPEYGPAKIVANNCKFIENEKQYSIGKGSELILDDRLIKGE